MNRNLVLFCVFLLTIFGLLIGFPALNKKNVQEVTFEQLFTNPDQFNGKNIVLEGFYFNGWEIIVLCEKLENSKYSEEHLVPNGSMIWIEGGIPQDVHEKLYKQQTMGPEERFGKIRIHGKFEYNGQYGHLGSYSTQIVPSKVVLLQWSP
jgi:hypothetical protein